MKDVQCYELFGGVALKNHAFSLAGKQDSVRFNILVHDFHCSVCDWVTPLLLCLLSIMK